VKHRKDRWKCYDMTMSTATPKTARTVDGSAIVLRASVPTLVSAYPEESACDSIAESLLRESIRRAVRHVDSLP